MWTPYGNQTADMRFRFEFVAHDTSATLGIGSAAPPFEAVPGDNFGVKAVGAAVQGAPAPQMQHRSAPSIASAG